MPKAKHWCESKPHNAGCDSGSYRYGCSGTYAGSPTTYDFVQKNGGLASEADYPYTSGKTGEDGTCNTGAAPPR